MGCDLPIRKKIEDKRSVTLDEWLAYVNFQIIQLG